MENDVPMTIDWIAALWENTLTAEEIADYLKNPLHVEQLRVQVRQLWRTHVAEMRALKQEPKEA